MYLRFKPIFAIAVLTAMVSVPKCSAQKQHSELDTAPAVSIHIPMGKYGHRLDTSYLYKCVRRDASQMGMYRLEGGYDSLQIRIWLGHDLAVKKNVVVLKYHHSQWSGELWTYTHGHTQAGVEFVESKTVTSVTPKLGWDNFTKDLIGFHILSLPNDESLSGYDGCGMDGIPYYFEISTVKEYRFFKYCNPEENMSRFKEARDVMGIANLLENEFSFKFTR